MAICPVCGCKTDELDFVSRVIGAEDKRICSFCDRQLTGLENASEPTEAQVRWLDAIIAKDVGERDSSILSALKAMRAKGAPAPQSQPAVQSAPSQPRVQKPAAKQAPVPAADSRTKDEVIEELTKRVEALEVELKSMKRKQMIKTIIELGAPVVMLILLIIVFFASGLYDSLQALMGLDGLAEMMGL